MGIEDGLKKIVINPWENFDKNCRIITEFYEKNEKRWENFNECKEHFSFKFQ